MPFYVLIINGHIFCLCVISPLGFRNLLPSLCSWQSSAQTCQVVNALIDFCRRSIFDQEGRVVRHRSRLAEWRNVLICAKISHRSYYLVNRSCDTCQRRVRPARRDSVICRLPSAKCRLQFMETGYRTWTRYPTDFQRDLRWHVQVGEDV